MLILGNFLIALAKVLGMALQFLTYLIFFRAIISWVNPDPYNPVVQFLNRTTEPILTPIRRRLPMGPIDISPIVAFLLIIFAQQFLIASLRDIGYHMRQSNSAPQIQSFTNEKQAPRSLGTDSLGFTSE